MEKVWVEASRPKTLPAAVAPVVIGTVLAYADRGSDLIYAFLCLLFALLIQVATNFTNDYYDFVNGADDESRIGPRRACASGLIAPETMQAAMVGTFILAAIIALPLIGRGGIPYFFVVLFSIGSGWAYTGGPYPLGYNGLGDLFVLIFFGPVAVGSTYYIQTLEMRPEILLIGLAPGLISTAILAVNNLRDVDGDSRSGKKTLAVRFGRRFGQAEYIVCLLLAALIPPYAAYQFGGSGFSLLTLLVIPFAAPVAWRVITKSDGPSLNGALAETGQLLLAFTAAFVLGRLL